jgi:creatinine amidohydrolase
MERHLQKLSWLTIRQLVPSQIDTVIFPAGTVEGHGSSCIGTDNFIPEILADGIAERINALVAPTLNYGITRSLIRYNGGSTIQEDNYKVFIRDILDSFADTGFHNIILMNGHGGNNSALKSVAFEFHQERQCNIAVLHWWDLCGKMTEEFFGHVGGHSGTDETAMVMSIDPALGGKDQYDPDLAWYFRPGADIYPVPGTILLYKEGEGHPDYSFDADRIQEYRQKVIQTVGDFAELVLSRWRKWGM